MSAVRLSPDEWMAGLAVDLWDEAFRGRLEQQLWELAKELLAAGQSVILDYGYWTRAERDEARRGARSLGVSAELHYLEIPIDELERRLQSRNNTGERRSNPITRTHLEQWVMVFEAPDGDELALFDAHFN